MLSILLVLVNYLFLSFIRRLGDEMRNMSLEKRQARETELMGEVERLQQEILSAQRSQEEGANISQKLSKEVSNVRVPLRQKHAIL